jgi:hypothetical protein
MSAVQYSTGWREERYFGKIFWKDILETDMPYLP